MGFRSADPALRYLGDHAFDALVEGIRGDNHTVALQSCHLLAVHGRRAVPQLISVLGMNANEDVRSAAASALGQTYHPDALEPLITSLDDSPRVRLNACRALGYLRNARAIEPLKKRVGDPNGHVARSSIKAIRQPTTTGTAFWPPELLNVRKLTVDAKTVRGEKFGKAEVDVLAKHLQSKYWDVRVQCMHALAALNAKQCVRQIIAAPPSISRAHVLAQMPTRAAVDALIKDLGSTDKQVKASTLSGIAGGAGRWAAPLLIAKLDDASLKVAGHEIWGFVAEGDPHTWPESHRAHSALWQFFSEHGLRGESRNLARGQTNNVAQEITTLRKWWKQHGEDFIAGKKVPNPKLTTVLSAS